ncbi:MAG: FKBP-type peptidyl-prolyl cis-trans isomerase, partial [Armatimonadetes bacterium]|nr:FKBP-type peptidyl-prolyl cis-trans isomerase [Armatimonadota bacterium]
MLSLALLLTSAQEPQVAPRPVAEPLKIATVRRGYGDATLEQARITVHFRAETEDGTVVADTESRGMPFTFLLGQDTVRRFWHAAVRGLYVGAVSTVRMPASTAGV